MIHRKLSVHLVLLLLLCLHGIVCAQEKGAAPRPKVTPEQLDAWLKQFPDADANRDGKLTQLEAFAYWVKLQEKIKKDQESRPKPTAADVKYGEYRRNVLDFWQAKSEKPTPALINFHGGGFVAGDKSAVNLEPFLKQGISVVSANYRFVKGDDQAAPYPAPMYDGARVVQFVRSKAQEWNIDPDRIALTGSSAGAVISMWIGYHDDLAQPDSKDPVARQSSRVACILPVAGPTNLDPAYILAHIGGHPDVHPSLQPFFAVADVKELQSADKQSLVREASPMTHVSPDDPPTFQLFGGELTKTPLPPDTDFNTSIHHAQFGVLLKKVLDRAGVPNELAYKGDGRTQVEQIAALQAFLQKHLGE